jgi:hypothetical protein
MTFGDLARGESFFFVNAADFLFASDYPGPYNKESRYGFSAQTKSGGRAEFTVASEKVEVRKKGKLS